MTLYDELVERGCRIDNHESDLYVKSTKEALEVIARYPSEKKMARFFRSQLDETLWIDVPFAFLPWWRNRVKNVA